jgi:hypothetical protein
MKDEDDIQDIVRQLSALQLKQNILLARLEKATEGEVDETPRPFQIGQAVKIKNLGLLQASKGRITWIGKDRITVTAEPGAKIVRAPKNLVMLEKGEDTSPSIMRVSQPTATPRPLKTVVRRHQHHHEIPEDGADSWPPRTPLPQEQWARRRRADASARHQSTQRTSSN